MRPWRRTWWHRSRRSLSANRRAQLFDVGLVVVDECHHAAASSYVTLLTHFGAFGTKPARGYDAEPAIALGVTATMIRGDDKALGEIWQDVVYSRSIADMIRDGWLVRPRGKRVRVRPNSISAASASLPGTIPAPSWAPPSRTR